jgi:RNA polymerase sigma factor (sigma-70 family)
VDELIDKDGSGHVLTVSMPSSGSHAARDADIERDYSEHRGAVLAMLRAEFPRLRDPEELYQEAWAELLAKEAAGETVHHRRGLLRTIAWRRAADTVKRKRPDAIDPTSPAFEAATDDQPLPDEQAQVRLDADALRMVVDSLDEQQAAVLKMRFDLNLTASEVQEQLGISEKRLEAVVTAAYKKIAAQFEVDEHGDTRWTRRQRSLLLACELGIASTRQRRRAQAMVDNDPHCRAMLRAMRSGLGDVAAVLPMPVIVQEHERLERIGRMPQRLDEILATGRHLAEKLSGRGLPESGALEPATVGGAGAGAGVVAVKVAALCLAVGGSAAVCVSVGGLLDEPPATANPPVTHHAQRVVEPPRDHVQVVRLPRTTTTPKSISPAKTTSDRHETPVSSPKSHPAISPAPQHSTEFGPGALGSTGAPKQPAAAPQDGGGEFAP